MCLCSSVNTWILIANPTSIAWVCCYTGNISSPCYRDVFPFFFFPKQQFTVKMCFNLWRLFSILLRVSLNVAKPKSRRNREVRFETVSLKSNPGSLLRWQSCIKSVWFVVAFRAFLFEDVNFYQDTLFSRSEQLFPNSTGNCEEGWLAASTMPSPLQDKSATSWKAEISEDSASKKPSHSYCNKEIGNAFVILYKGVGGSRGKWTIRERKRILKVRAPGKQQRAAVTE